MHLNYLEVWKYKMKTYQYIYIKYKVFIYFMNKCAYAVYFGRGLTLESNLFFYEHLQRMTPMDNGAQILFSKREMT